MRRFLKSLNAFKWAVLINLLCLLFGLVTFDLFFSINLLYHANTIVIPLLFIYEWYSKRGTGKTGWFWRFPLAFALIAIYIYATHIEPERLQVKEFTISSSKITAPITLVHISDVQSNGIGSYETEVFELIKTYRPDVVLHTGDLIQTYSNSSYPEELDALAELFTGLGDEVLKYHVNGDTEHPPSIDELQFAQKANTTILKNELVNIEVKGQGLQIGGLVLRQSRSPDAATLQRVGTNNNPSSFMLLMGHAPDFVLSLPENETAPDLCLAGHTHGGQIRLPGIGPLLTLSDVPKGWARGTTELEHTTLNVSAGIGAEHAGYLPSIRINCPPEFTVIYLQPE